MDKENILEKITSVQVVQIFNDGSRTTRPMVDPEKLSQVLSDMDNRLEETSDRLRRNNTRLDELRFRIEHDKRFSQEEKRKLCGNAESGLNFVKRKINSQEEKEPTILLDWEKDFVDTFVADKIPDCIPEKNWEEMKGEVLGYIRNLIREALRQREDEITKYIRNREYEEVTNEDYISKIDLISFIKSSGK